MKIIIWGNQYPLRLDTRDLHLSFPGIETMERNKAKDSDLDYITFYIKGSFLVFDLIIQNLVLKYFLKYMSRNYSFYLIILINLRNLVYFSEMEK